jgi:hypothetical protein
MVLNESQIEHYFREGYIVARGLIPQKTVDQVLSKASSHVKASMSDHLQQGGTVDGWQPVIFNQEDPDSNDLQLHQFLWQPQVVEAATQLLGTPPRLYWGMLATVPPHGGNGLPWHQDAQYIHLLGNALNIFIAMVRIAPEAANLWIAPRSHTRGVQPSENNTTTAPGHHQAVIEPDNGFCLPTLEPGDACIFDRLTYHRSQPNTTNQPRYAYSCQYAAMNAREAATGKIPNNRPISELSQHFQKTR